MRSYSVLEFDNGRTAKLWLEPGQVEDSAREQITSMATIPNLFRHLAIMPDCHYGKGATVGAVMALKNAVVPNCVGVDIGCGMAVVPTGLRFSGEHASREFWRDWLGKAQRAVPSGFSSHPEAERDRNALARRARMLQHFGAEPLAKLHLGIDTAPTKKFSTLEEQIERQAGTLGGGNHFLEVQSDEDGMLWLMVHSGSRNIGLRIAEHYDRAARALNEREQMSAPQYLNWLPLDSEQGADYLADMQWAVDYALFNRKEMLRSALSTLDLEFDEAAMINIPHNYAALEQHFGEDVIVHRKGATRARSGEVGIIPGSMGTKSYIVRGRGNSESYDSCSHGAGRAMGRKDALRRLSTNDFAQAIAGTFSKPSSAYLDEAPQAYKDIDEVMASQAELVEITKVLTPVITLKSSDGSVD